MCTHVASGPHCGGHGRLRCAMEPQLEQVSASPGVIITRFYWRSIQRCGLAVVLFCRSIHAVGCPGCFAVPASVHPPTHLRRFVCLHEQAVSTSYEGSAGRDGRWDGPGRVTYRSGATYAGQMENGMMHGRGKLAFPDGITYDGDFEHNQMTGTGVSAPHAADARACQRCLHAWAREQPQHPLLRRGTRPPAWPAAVIQPP